MNLKNIKNKCRTCAQLVIYILIFGTLTITIDHELRENFSMMIAENTLLQSEYFIAQRVEESLMEDLMEVDNKSKLTSLLTCYWLELSIQEKGLIGEIEFLESKSKLWAEEENYEEQENIVNAIWQDIQYFPIPISLTKTSATVSYVDSWGFSRSYGGERLHEGCDIMGDIDQPGLYPILSITDGIVTNKGWLEKGGYRIGITAPSGGYFYYAHLDSYVDVEVGDSIYAGQIIGYMGDSGYGEEGTTGMFATHLHLGIYLYIDDTEYAVNPYNVLRYLDNKRLYFDYE